MSLNWETTSKWNEVFMLQATQLAKLGLTDAQIAVVWGISLDTLDVWKNNKQGLYYALQQGRTIALGEVVEGLFRAAVGYEYEEDAITSYQGEITVTRVKKYKGPNPWAAAKILAVRDRSNWSEVQRTESIHTNINIAKLDLSTMSPEMLKAIENEQKKQLTENVGNS
jgi:hypothetical protein